MPLAYRRIYIDLPTDTADAFKVLAAQRGKSQRALFAEIVEAEIKSAKSVTRKRRTTTKGKK